MLLKKILREGLASLQLRSSLGGAKGSHSGTLRGQFIDKTIDKGSFRSNHNHMGTDTLHQINHGGIVLLSIDTLRVADLAPLDGGAAIARTADDIGNERRSGKSNRQSVFSAARSNHNDHILSLGQRRGVQLGGGLLIQLGQRRQGPRGEGALGARIAFRAAGTAQSRKDGVRRSTNERRGLGIVRRHDAVSSQDGRTDGTGLGTTKGEILGNRGGKMVDHEVGLAATDGTVGKEGAVRGAGEGEADRLGSNRLYGGDASILDGLGEDREDLFGSPRSEANYFSLHYILCYA
mmetsp:Transcript_15520/g.44933  ORF Transcript_15520/g.44933 Transcript_15520/m.44933 type:complete len:292 (+) Transcript_15520:2793-3668(+)